ncbi:MAG: hypothetical protein OEY67_00705 [Gammaproteobacteria bacterium]|nr:hypothetical protein [Gammaproteobacteria bacterium]
MSDSHGEHSQDIAWASLTTPLSTEDLNQFCQDIERLFRINPYLEFNQWQAVSDRRYRFSGRNLSQEQPFEFDYELTVHPSDKGLRIDYNSGIKSNTEIKIEPEGQGSKLTITDRYERLPENEREAYLHEVDKSLVAWANYMRTYLTSWRRWSWFGPWRWYMRRIWQPMKPTARRITYVLLWITVFEIALIALGVAIYFIEYR